MNRCLNSADYSKNLNDSANRKVSRECKEKPFAN